MGIKPTEIDVRGMKIKVGTKVKFFRDDHAWTVKDLGVGTPPVVIVTDGERTLTLLAANIWSVVESK